MGRDYHHHKNKTLHDVKDEVSRVALFDPSPHPEHQSLPHSSVHSGMHMDPNSPLDQTTGATGATGTTLQYESCIVLISSRPGQLVAFPPFRGLRRITRLPWLSTSNIAVMAA